MKLDKLKVLIVDDNATDRLIIRGMLQKLQIRSIQDAEDGSIAESKILNALEVGASFDFIVLDWNMPKKNGLKILQFVRSNSKIKDTKIVIMTATADKHLVEDAMDAGVNDFLVKPVEIDSLKLKLENLFSEND